MDAFIALISAAGIVFATVLFFKQRLASAVRNVMLVGALICANYLIHGLTDSDPAQVWAASFCISICLLVAIKVGGWLGPEKTPDATRGHASTN